ncbi:DUF2169 family type VI secretion system accessory protein [Polyangium mundeleinium]|uniref:DUF2169 domain-containing protein n=1 Tax=Polyangium mundeleinium TaxID=2995306 RepID=A0ABT5F0C3_9BACT|nr:DUF2169 domain-containing protein [Polyangium mundeleinium]MDC0747530.1 DUF2169 domain-containing protein [Polyangium mundeleinium]
MHVSASPPLAVAKLVWQPRPDAFVMTVVCKATYALRNGPCELVGLPDAPQTMDIYWQDGSPRSLRLPNDLAPFKRHVDVMVVGHAWAPQGQAVPSLVARLAVGSLNKALVVYGDRYWLPEGRLSDAVPFTRMPLRWMRAAGGPRSWNPVGIPPSMDANAPGHPPNFEPVSHVLRSPTQEVPPVGLGPIAARWPTRVEHLRAHRSTWPHEGWHERPLPAGVDASYWNAAPKDQQITELPAQAQILLEHLNPEQPRMIALVEDVRPRAMVTRSGSSPQEVWLRADTLLIDTDRGVCSVTWRAAVPLRHAKEEGVVVVAPTRGIGALRVAPAQATPERGPTSRTMTMPALGAPRNPAAAVPFVPSSAPVVPPPAPRRERPPLSFARDDDEVTPTGNVGKPEGFETLPFQRSPLRQAPTSSPAPASASAPAPAPPPMDPDDDGTQTLVPPVRPAAAATLPFVASGMIAPGDDGTGTLLPGRQAAPSALPFRAPEPAAAAEEPEPATERKPKLQPDAALPFGNPTPAASPLLVPSGGGVVPSEGGSTHLAGGSTHLAGGGMHLAGGGMHLAGGGMHLAGGGMHLGGGVAPSAGGIVPSAGGIVPSAGGIVPSAGGIVPSAGGIVPLAGSIVPLAGSIVPLAGGIVPSAGSVVPSAGGIVPSAGGIVPSAGGIVPSVGGIVPSAGGVGAARGELSVERYARIKVDLWGAQAALHEVLSRYGIDEVAWRVHERQQAEALAGEAREGRCDLALALCAAFEAAKAPGVAPPPLGGIA